LIYHFSQMPTKIYIHKLVLAILRLTANLPLYLNFNLPSSLSPSLFDFIASFLTLFINLRIIMGIFLRTKLLYEIWR